jgi:hypothetical protein
MPCQHKFIEFLKLEKLDFKPTTLIVGTFNPVITTNTAEWFYGRHDNNFWVVLPRIFGEKSMRCSTPADWKSFCKHHLIAITDLISCIEDADLANPLHYALLKTYSDKSIAVKFHQHSNVRIVKLLRANPSIKNLYLARGTGDTFWKNLWEPVEEYAKLYGIYENKLMTPSRNAFYQQGRYNKQNPLNPLNLEDFILKKWKEKWRF